MRSCLSYRRRGIGRGEGTGDWGLGTGDWGLGTGDWGMGDSGSGLPFAQLPSIVHVAMSHMSRFVSRFLIALRTGFSDMVEIQLWA